MDSEQNCQEKTESFSLKKAARSNIMHIRDTYVSRGVKLFTLVKIGGI